MQIARKEDVGPNAIATNTAMCSLQLQSVIKHQIWQKASNYKLQLATQRLQQTGVDKQPLYAVCSALELRHGANQTLGNRQLNT